MQVRGSALQTDSVIIQDNEGIVSGAGIGAYEGSTISLLNSYVRRNAATNSYNGGGLYISDSTLEMEGGKLQSNSASQGAGLYAASARVSLSGIDVKSNDASSHGGAIRARDASTLTVEECTVDSNEAGGRGGAAYLSDSDSDWVDATLSDNQGGTGGGALYLDDQANTGTSFQGTISGSVAGGAGGAIWLSSGTLILSGDLRDNTPGADANGGAIYALNATLAISDASIEGHQAAHGGAIYLSTGDTVTLDRVTLGDNRSAQDGGAIYSKSDLLISDSAISGNQAGGGGGGIYLLDASLELSGTELSSNQAGSVEGGGAIYTHSAALDIDQCTISDNQAGYGGGLVFIGSGAEDPRIVRSTFSGNLAWVDGGAIHATDANTLRLRIDTVQDNSAEGLGGGVFLDAPGYATVYDVDFLSNQAEVGGGLYMSGPWGGRTEQCLFGGNTASSSGGGAAFVSPGGSHGIYNDRFVENAAEDGGGLLIKGDSTGLFPIHNIDVSGNESDGLYLHQSAGAQVVNLIAWGNTGIGVRADGSSDSASIRYSDAAGNDTDWGGSLPSLTGVDGNISKDPHYLAFAADGDATDDDLELGDGSPCLDAGDPELLDIDGGRSDMGSYGGPDATQGNDGEPGGGDTGGTDTGLDDTGTTDTATPDDTSAPIADADGDGSPFGEDCDDQDSNAFPGNLEDCDDGIDNDCNGFTDANDLTCGELAPPRCEGCATSHARGFFWLLLLPALVRRRQP